MGIGVGFKLKKRPLSARKRVDIMLDGAKKAMLSVGTQHVTQREKVIATWNNETPSWLRQVDQDGPFKLHMFVFMTGHAFGMKKWYWLDQGTKIRFATMTKNFKAKTRPRIISSTAGRGHRVYVSRRRPRKGIEKREFDLTVNERLTKRLDGRIDTVLKRALKRKR